jgi:outer membrane protein assembly factor BamE
MNMDFHCVIRSLPALWLAAPLALLLASCKSVDMPKVPGITPYRMVIQQGNFISQEMVSQLKPGMTREQVRFIMGTPLVTDIFHADRWDYVFFRELANGKREQRNLSVVFEKDKLARVIGDLMPAEGAAPATGGFEPLLKPDAKPAAKPVAEVPKEVPKPAAEAPPAAPPGGQNWRAASDEPEKKPEPAPAAKEEPKKPEEQKAAEEPKEERGFFGRMLEKIGL